MEDLMMRLGRSGLGHRMSLTGGFCAEALSLHDEIEVSISSRALLDSLLSPTFSNEASLSLFSSGT